MTFYVLAYLFVSLAVMALGWLKGGHAERLGVVFWIACWVPAVVLNDIRIGELRVLVAAIDLAAFGAFLWLALRFDRWWPLGVSACLMLVLAVHLSALLAPEVTRFGEASAQLGLGFLAVLIQGAGVFERWLAGERPASEAAMPTRSGTAS